MEQQAVAMNMPDIPGEIKSSRAIWQSLALGKNLTVLRYETYRAKPPLILCKETKYSFHSLYMLQVVPRYELFGCGKGVDFTYVEHGKVVGPVSGDGFVVHGF